MHTLIADDHDITRLLVSSPLTRHWDVQSGPNDLSFLDTGDMSTGSASGAAAPGQFLARDAVES